MANTKRAADSRFERAVYFATREAARRLAWLLLIVAAVAALAGGGKGSALRAEEALGRRSR